jgi:DNA-directed RNA polymerase specialized sigma24 family protein
VAEDAAQGTPVDNEDMVRRYRGYMKGLVRKLGIPSQEADDVTNEILTRLMERDVIGMYEPDKGTFRNFLSAQVARYTSGQRDKLRRSSTRELLMLDAPADNEGHPWIEIFGGAQIWDDYSALDAEQFVQRMRAHLATIERRSRRDGLSLVKLWDEIIAEIRESGEFTSARIQQRFSVSDTTASGWIRRLRAVAGRRMDGLTDPMPEVAGVRFSIADIRLSLECVRKYERGNHMPKNADHPLGRHPDPRWYHTVARAELKEFPECKQARAAGKGGAGAGHVKAAVVHFLERILAEADVPEIAPPAQPEPEEPLTQREQLEAELWRHGFSAERVDFWLGLLPA